MARLPIVGGDDNDWGDILNTFLAQEHNSDGSQKTLDLTKGGTGATDAATARSNLSTIANNDSRLSDARTPTVHAASHLGGGDDVLASLDSRYVAASKLVLPVVFSYSGSLAVVAGAGRFPSPVTGTIQNVRIAVGTAPVGASILVDVNKAGTTIFTTQGNRPSIAASATSSSAAVPDVTSVNAGDLLSADIDQTGTTTPGSDLTVVVLIRPS